MEHIQFITYGDKQINMKTIGTIWKFLGPLLLLIFLSDLHKVKKYLDPIIFAENKIFFIVIKM